MTHVGYRLVAVRDTAWLHRADRAPVHRRGRYVVKNACQKKDQEELKQRGNWEAVIPVANVHENALACDARGVSGL